MRKIFVKNVGYVNCDIEGDFYTFRTEKNDYYKLRKNNPTIRELISDKELLKLIKKRLSNRNIFKVDSIVINKLFDYELNEIVDLLVYSYANMRYEYSVHSNQITFNKVCSLLVKELSFSNGLSEEENKNKIIAVFEEREDNIKSLLDEVGKKINNSLYKLSIKFYINPNENNIRYYDVRNIVPFVVSLTNIKTKQVKNFYLTHTKMSEARLNYFLHNNITVIGYKKINKENEAQIIDYIVEILLNNMNENSFYKKATIYSFDEDTEKDINNYFFVKGYGVSKFIREKDNKTTFLTGDKAHTISNCQYREITNYKLIDKFVDILLKNKYNKDISIDSKVITKNVLNSENDIFYSLEKLVEVFFSKLTQDSYYLFKFLIQHIAVEYSITYGKTARECMELILSKFKGLHINYAYFVILLEVKRSKLYFENHYVGEKNVQFVFLIVEERNDIVYLTLDSDLDKQTEKILIREYAYIIRYSKEELKSSTKILKKLDILKF